ncbi:SymE family type I addiction module toxin [Thiohalomonas denitrificans]|uniref:SymE family type I addiction module toxin n=1 Tax=Thiohalomonas denitrificans TaxID=415747 RepID=UPI0039839370
MKNRPVPATIQPAGHADGTPLWFSTTPTPLIAIDRIQLKGRWLHEAGFAIGTSVRVRVSPGRLVLTIEG